MACGLSNSSFMASILIAFLLMITPSSARLSIKVSSQDIQKICSKTLTPTFCLAFLNAVPGADKADLPGLAKITLDLAHANATATQSVIQSLIKTSKDPELKKRYTSCSGNYDEAISDIELAQKFLKTGDYNGINTSASAAMDLADNCDENFGSLPKGSASLVKGNQDLKHIGGVILVISNLLPH